VDDDDDDDDDNTYSVCDLVGIFGLLYLHLGLLYAIMGKSELVVKYF